MRTDDLEITTAPSAQTETVPEENPSKEGHPSETLYITQPEKHRVSRITALMRLIRIALSNPLLTLRMLNFRFFKNFLQFLVSNDVDGYYIINKYKQIYSNPYRGNNTWIRITTMFRLMCIALSNPKVTIKLINPQLIKKSIRFLIKTEGDADHILSNYEAVYRNPNAEKIVISHAGAKGLALRYGLNFYPSKNITMEIPSEDLSSWIDDLRQLADSLPDEKPTISIIIPVYNHIRFTLACIHSIFINAGRYDFEIIIADDLSTDETHIAFAQNIRRVRYHRNKNNLGFLNNCYQAAESAQGRFLVFLNNDIIVLPGWLDELVKPLEENPDIGLVGSKLIYPDGRLQEAGGIIFADAGGWNYGHFDDPGKPEYNYLRDVDYCSGASIAISSDLWRSLGGFDRRFSPAYYEDTDLAFQVRNAGKRVVYNPLSEVVHFEGISHGISENDTGKHNQPINRLKFLSKWKNILPAFGNCDSASLPAVRNCKGRILFVDAVTPTPDKDSGSVDAYNYMKIFKDLGYHATFIPENLQYCGHYTHALRRLGVECIHLPFFTDLKKAIIHYAPLSNYVLLYRAPVAHPLVAVVRKSAPRAKIIFNTVDLHFLRQEREASITGSASQLLAAKYMKNKELDIIKNADATILLSTHEMELVQKVIGGARLFHIPIVRQIPQISYSPWEQRKDIVFIGGYNHVPNIDAVLFFVKSIWPHLLSLGFPGHFIVAGSDMPAEIMALVSDKIIIRGYVADLSEFFDACRFSVAPLRYGAGMKGKVISSLSHGVPCITTSIATEGTGLVHGQNILVEDDPKKMARLIQRVYDDKALWEKLSEAGVNYCHNYCSLDSVKKKLNFMLSEITETQ